MKMLLAGIFLSLWGLSVSAGPCERPNEEGCFNLVLLNAAWDANNPIFAGLDQPASNETERTLRVNTIGAYTFDAFKKGEVSASTPRSYVVFMWGITASLEDITSYHMELKDGRGLAIKDEIAMVIEQLPPEKILHSERLKEQEVSTADAQKMMDEGAVILPTFEDGTDPGMPSAVYRVTVTGFDQSLQFPWSKIGSDSLVLMCQTDYDGVYPDGGEKGKGNKKGHWIASESFNFLRTAADAEGDRKPGGGYPAQGILIPFVSR